MIKRALAFVMSAALLLSCAGCVGVTFWGGNYYSETGYETVLGSGSMTTLEYTVGEYTTLMVDSEGEIELYYKAEQSDKVVIELQENLAEHLTVSVKNGVLLVKADKRLKTDEDKRPKLYISAPALEKIDVGGALSIKQADTIKTDSFTLDIAGVSDGTLPLEVTTLNVDVSGACGMILSGSTDDMSITMAGASSVNALGLQAKRGSVDVSGVGEVSVNCSETLDINGGGAVSVSYKGNPRISQNIGGAISIKRLD